MKTTIDLKCTFKDLNIFTPTKQFNFSKKETYNCRLVFSITDKEQLTNLSVGMLGAKNEGLQNLWDAIKDYPNGLIYPTTYGKETVEMVACTFFKPTIQDANGKELQSDVMQTIISKGQFYGKANISFYPYCKGTRYGIGTNLNAITFLSLDAPTDAGQKEKKINDAIKEEEKEKMEMTKEYKTQCIKACSLSYEQNGKTYNFNFDLVKNDKPLNKFIVVQEQTNPNTLNVALYDLQYFKYDVFWDVMPCIIAKLQNNEMQKIPTNDLELSNLYRFAIGYFPTDNNQ